MGPIKIKIVHDYVNNLMYIYWFSPECKKHNNNMYNLVNTMKYIIAQFDSYILHGCIYLFIIKFINLFIIRHFTLFIHLVNMYSNALVSKYKSVEHLYNILCYTSLVLLCSKHFCSKRNILMRSYCNLSIYIDSEFEMKIGRQVQ